MSTVNNANDHRPDPEYMHHAHGVFPLADQKAPIPAKTFNESFKQDWEAADEKWKYKRVAVTGLVRYKGPDIFGVPSLELSDSADGACEVLACFHDERAMASVREGDLVVVRGNYLTESGRFGVVLKMCDLVR